MKRHPKIAALRRDSRAGISAALLALTFFLLLLSHARADDSQAPPPQDDMQQPSQLSMPGCTDQMDFSPEINLPSPFDADDVAWRLGHGKPVLKQRIADDSDASCGGVNETPVEI